MSPATLTLAAAGAAPALILLWLVGPARRLAVGLAPAAALPALALAVWGRPVHVFVPAVFTGIHLGLDPVGRAFLFFTAALWVAGGAYALRYLAGDPRRDGFFAFFLLTLTGQLLLVLAQDILTFYLGFALMTFAGYGLVVHTATDAARRAGRVYIAMAVGGEALLLGALLLIGAAAAGWTLADVPAAYAATPAPGLVAALALAGFAVKAGLVPLHLWLPLAHPVAPTPASALLSGAMIKAGVLGWIRFLPLGDLAFPTTGAVLVGVGVAAALYGVVAGLAQVEPKTVLAYSSVSQMGYMAVGVGVAVMAPTAAGAAVLAVAHYAGHHAAAKAALFLAVGVAPAWLAGGGRDGGRDGGGGRPGGVPGARARRLLLHVGLAIPALALAGAPFTSGSVAKSALKHAGDTLGEPWNAHLALLLSLAAAGTALLLARFLVTLQQAATRGQGRGVPGPAYGQAQAEGRGRPVGQQRGAPAGLLLPWAALVGLSLAAPAWLPRVFPAPPGVTEPFPVLGVFDSLWPLGLGLVLAAAAWRYESHLPVRAGAIPPGDILEPVARALNRLARAARAVARPVPPLGWSWATVSPGVRRAGGTAARLDTRLAGGGLFAAALLLLIGLLAVSLLR